MTAQIVPMTPADLDFAIAMTDSENWGYLRSDFERMVSLQPEGCFVAREMFGRMGIITTALHGDYGFMGTLIVQKSRRRHGTGEALFARAFEYLKERGTRTIELDGVFSAVSMYRRLGFRDKYLSLRLYRAPQKYDEVSVPQLSPSIDEILRFDREVVGLDRSAIIRSLFASYGESLVAVGGDRLCGYALVYPRGGERWSIGPLVARSHQDAARILRALVGRYSDRHLGIGVPQLQCDFVNSLMSEGFCYKNPSLRMFAGERLEIERCVFGIIAPEKG
jgi:ribosomal protein S18 acetylase RimI-like enzyme